MDEDQKAALAAMKADRAVSAKFRFMRTPDSINKLTTLSPSTKVSDDANPNPPRHPISVPMEGTPLVGARNNGYRKNSLRSTVTGNAPPSGFIADNVLELTSGGADMMSAQNIKDRRTKSSLYGPDIPKHAPPMRAKATSPILSETTDSLHLVEGDDDIKARMPEMNYMAYIAALDCLIHPFTAFGLNDIGPDVKKLMERLGIGSSGSTSPHMVVARYDINAFRQMYDTIVAIVDNSKSGSSTPIDEQQILVSHDPGKFQDDVKIQHQTKDAVAHAKSTDEVYRLALLRFNEEILTGVAELIEKGRNTSQLVSLLFAEIVRLQLYVVGNSTASEYTPTSTLGALEVISDSDIPKDEGADTGDIGGVGVSGTAGDEAVSNEQIALHLTQRFQKDVLSHAVADISSPTTPIGHIRSNSSLNAQEAASVGEKLNQADAFLAYCFQVPMATHLQIREKRMRKLTDEKLTSELRSRERLLDDNSFYNKDAFVHKTAAFMRWKEDESTSIQLMLKTLGSKSQPMLPRPNRVNHGELRVDVLRARDLCAKNSNGFSNPYCLFEISTGEQKSTTTKKKTLDPVWDELLTFNIRSRELSRSHSLKVSLWNVGTTSEDSNAQHTITRQFRKAVDSDSFLGQFSLEGITPQAYERPREKWFELTKRSKRSKVSGEVLLRLHFVPVESIQKEVDAKYEYDLEKLQRESMDVTATLPDYHALYKCMISTCLSRELVRWRHRSQDQFSDGFMRPEWLNLLCEEFGLRYGVGRLYRVLCDLRITVDNYHQNVTDVDMVHLRLEEIEELCNGDVRWTKQEVELFCACLTELDGLFSKYISSYKDYFPYSTPPGKLAAYVDSLRLIIENVMYNQRKISTSVSGVLTECVKINCQRTFMRYSAMSTPVSVSPTFEDFSLQISDLSSYLTREIENDALYFKADFVNAETHAPLISLVPIVTRNYVQLLNDEIEDMLPQFIRKSATGEKIVIPTAGPVYTKAIMQAFIHLSKFNHLILTIQNERGLNDSTARAPSLSFSPPMLSLFGVVVEGFLEWTKDEVEHWLQKAIANDKFLPMSEEEQHSTSCTDVFWALSEVLTFMQSMKITNTAQWSRCMQSFVKILCTTVRHYMGEISKRSRHESVRLEEQEGLYMPSEMLCTLINNFVMSARYLQIISSNLGIKTTLLNEILDDEPVSADDIDDPQSGTFTRRFQSHVANGSDIWLMNAERRGVGDKRLSHSASIVSSTPAIRSMIEHDMSHTSRMVALCLVGTVRMLGSRVVKPIRYTISKIVNKDSLFGSFKYYFAPDILSVQKPVKARRDEDIVPTIGETYSSRWKRNVDRPLSVEVAEDMAPTLAYFDDVMAFAAIRLYPHAVYLLLEEMWTQVLQCTEKTLETGDASSGPSLDRLSESVMQLWEFFHADGQGLSNDVKQRPRFQTLEKVIQLLRRKDMDGLIAMHSLIVRDKDQLMFLTNTMSAVGDRKVKDYLATAQILY
eukprot:CFRG2472T1